METNNSKKETHPRRRLENPNLALGIHRVVHAVPADHQYLTPPRARRVTAPRGPSCEVRNLHLAGFHFSRYFDPFHLHRVKQTSVTDTPATRHPTHGPHLYTSNTRRVNLIASIYTVIRVKTLTSQPMHTDAWSLLPRGLVPPAA